MNEMEKKIYDDIERFDMLPYGASVVVGVSGGSDSMCLLCFLLKIQKERHLKITVAHVNHMLRGQEAERDEKFVIGFCKEKKVPVKVLRKDVKLEAKKQGLSVEECGREVRYKFFDEVAENETTKIATAHTLSDSVETLILNMSKGTSLSGLCGIPPVRGRIIRPIISLKKAETVKYCRDNSIDFIEDSSNFDVRYTRNKIRLEVIPKLLEVNPNLENAFYRSMENFRLGEIYLQKISKAELEKAKLSDCKYNLNILRKLDRAVLSRVIKLVLGENFAYTRLEFTHMKLIFDIITNGTGTVTLPRDVYVKAEDDVLSVFEKTEKLPLKKLFIPLIKQNNCLTENSRKFIIRIVKRADYERLCDIDAGKNALDCDKIPEGSVFRNREEKDKFSPLRRNVTKSLKKFFNEQKVPINKRESLAILAHESTVIWLEGFGITEQFKVDENTQNVLLIEVK